jgi:hypothetical protein
MITAMLHDDDDQRVREVAHGLVVLAGRDAAAGELVRLYGRTRAVDALMAVRPGADHVVDLTGSTPHVTIDVRDDAPSAPLRRARKAYAGGADRPAPARGGRAIWL